MRRLTVFAPGLFGPDLSVHPDDLPDLPALNWLLGRGTRRLTTEHASASDLLCELSNLPKDINGNYPIAAITHLADRGQSVTGRWLRADPVHIAIDVEGPRLIDSNRFELSRREAQAMVADINPLLKPFGLALEVPVPNRWYLRGHDDLKLKTLPLDAVSGQIFSPESLMDNDNPKLAGLLNEIQMTLHDSAVNRKRLEQRSLPINSLWLWGDGELLVPPDTANTFWSFIAGDGILEKGLSMIAATPFQVLPEHYDALELMAAGRRDDDVLIVINDFRILACYHDLEGWLAALKRYEANWFVPLQTALKTNRVGSLRIVTDRYTVTLGKNARFKFWKTGNTIQSLTAHGDR